MSLFRSIADKLGGGVLFAGAFLVRTQAERVHLFRMHLRATVRSASPLLLDLATDRGIDLHAAAGSIHPPQDWPWRPIDGHPLAARFRQRKAWLGSGGAGPARPLDHVVDHPILNGRDYALRRAVADPVDGLPVLEFRVRPVAFDMFPGDDRP